MLGGASSSKKRHATDAALASPALGMSGGKAQAGTDLFSGDDYSEERWSKRPELSLENRLAKSQDQVRCANEHSYSLQTQLADLHKTIAELKKTQSVDPVKSAGQAAGSDLLRDHNTPWSNELQMQKALIEIKNTELACKEQTNAVQGTVIASKDTELVQLRASVKQHVTTVAAKDAELVQLRASAASVEQHVATVAAQGTVIASKEMELVQLRVSVKQHVATVAGHVKDIESKEKQLQCMSTIINRHATDGCSVGILANIQGLKHHNLELEETVRALQFKLQDSHALVARLNMTAHLQGQQNATFSSVLQHETGVVKAHVETIAGLRAAKVIDEAEAAKQLEKLKNMSSKNKGMAKCIDRKDQALAMKDRELVEQRNVLRASEVNLLAKDEDLSKSRAKVVELYNRVVSLETAVPPPRG
ncbi:hypothetical protein T484DRAFT_1847632 [Baffinella frigidus]|nr:hypothetical protein T484DRAFT_1847632 [Cryptophyta sp. CCMP2293]